MASTPRAPKQWCLTKIETVNTFVNWRQNLVYTLSLDKDFAPFLISGAWWEKKTKATPFRGFSDDDESIPQAIRLSREQKVNMLDLMLGQIASYCPIISRNWYFGIVYFRKHTYSLLELHVSITESEQITNTQIYKYTTYKVAKKNKWRIIN